MEVVTQSAQETQALGQKIGHRIKKGKVVALYGELGGGKTTFIQGLAQGLGIKKRIISPTFVFIRQYPLKENVFYHVDLYRPEKLEETKGLGLKEILAEPGAIVAIEWAEKIKPILPKKRMEIFFEYLDEDKRKIRIKE